MNGDKKSLLLSLHFDFLINFWSSHKLYLFIHDASSVITSYVVAGKYVCTTHDFEGMKSDSSEEHAHQDYFIVMQY